MKAKVGLKRADTSARYKSQNLRPRNRIVRLKNQNLNRTDTIGWYKNWNLTSTDCIVRYNRKIESVSEDWSIGPFAYLCLYIPTIGLPFLLQIKKMDWSWEYTNRSQIHECGNWERGCAVSFLGIHKPDLFAVYCPTSPPFPFSLLNGKKQRVS
jgi:hypothetical protein